MGVEWEVNRSEYLENNYNITVIYPIEVCLLYYFIQ